MCHEHDSQTTLHVVWIGVPLAPRRANDDTNSRQAPFCCFFLHENDKMMKMVVQFNAGWFWQKMQACNETLSKN